MRSPLQAHILCVIFQPQTQTVTGGVGVGLLSVHHGQVTAVFWREFPSGLSSSCPPPRQPSSYSHMFAYTCRLLHSEASFLGILAEAHVLGPSIFLLGALPSLLSPSAWIYKEKEAFCMELLLSEMIPPSVLHPSDPHPVFCGEKWNIDKLVLLFASFLHCCSRWIKAWLIQFSSLSICDWLTLRTYQYLKLSCLLIGLVYYLHFLSWMYAPRF